MRLDFNVLWIDDQPKNMEQSILAIDRRLRREGFRLKHVMVTDASQAVPYLKGDIYGDHIDLILVDYELAGEETGGDALPQIRAALPYKDIVFYSSQADALQRTLEAKSIAGVFCSNRQELPDTVLGVFQELVRKIVDIDHARGIVMGASSDIDSLVRECIVALFSGSGGRIKPPNKSIVDARISRIEKRFSEKLGRCREATEIKEVLSEPDIFNSSQRLILLRKLLEQIDSHSGDCDGMTEYENKIVPQRNILGHVKVTRENLSCRLVTDNGKEIRLEDVKNLFEGLLNHQEAFENLLSKIEASNSETSTET